METIKLVVISTGEIREVRKELYEDMVKDGRISKFNIFTEIKEFAKDMIEDAADMLESIVNEKVDEAEKIVEDKIDEVKTKIKVKAKKTK